MASALPPYAILVMGPCQVCTFETVSKHHQLLYPRLSALQALSVALKYNVLCNEFYKKLWTISFRNMIIALSDHLKAFLKNG
jgi:hypothetical protein